MKKQQLKEKVYYFKRWSRKNYAAFSSLKKLVVIATVSMGCSFLAKPTEGIAQTNGDSTVMLLEKITVTAEEMPPETDGLSKGVIQFAITQNEIERVPALSVDQLLEQLPGMEIRQRGPFGTQADISYRGGNFDQTMILLNGVNFSDPQTGHYSLNLPISPEIIQKIELFNNSTSFLFGTSPFSGLINIITKPEDKNSVAVQFSGGMYGYFNGGVDVNVKTGKVKHLLSFNHSRSDGYRHNTDFELTNVFYHLQGDFKKGILEFQSGYADKRYGANGFYSTRFPDQYESTKTFITSISWHSTGKIEWKPTLYYRNNADCFELVKNQPKEKNNYHISHVAGLNFLGSLKSRAGKTSLSVDFRGEDIRSTSLGGILQTPAHSSIFDIDFTNGRTRMISSLSLSHVYKRKGWEASLSALANYFFDLEEKFYFLPAGYVSYQFRAKEKTNSLVDSRLFLSAATSVRTPTFTDLYYKTGDIQGNSNLLPEKAFTAELGYKVNVLKNDRKNAWLYGTVSIFNRLGYRMIDYIKSDDDVLWRTINHTNVNFIGIDMQIAWQPNNFWHDDFPVSQVAIKYSYLYSDKESSGYQSRYVLDHLIHNLTLNLSHAIYKTLTIDYAFSYRKRKGEYTSYAIEQRGQPASYPAYGVLDLKLNYEWRTAKFYVEISNVLNQKYFDIGDLEQPGAWVIGGVRVKINQ
ncbi:TonB-dependent receptor plug domain-containing protein [Bacteroidales bacterium OttesenSCG-928-B11]|nr:TonB-dependent receptor plug domain-containing protein [Bacteroidales bacterium OttesenSCG-928-B11]MDL2326689.1 TonB-dependent receptor plug domain-containing protein [Bacteroidales bacterium OttesenSCG-928-A14]